MNQEFQDFVKNFKFITEKKTDKLEDGETFEWEDARYVFEKWYHSKDDMPSIDFNREICKPGQSKVFPDGAIGIRCDDDFWLCAIYPYKFVDVPLTEVVGAFWPDLPKEDIVYNDDVDFDHDGCGFAPVEDVKEAISE